MAVEAYERCRGVLAELLDVTPSAETQKLLAEIRGSSSSRIPPRASGYSAGDRAASARGTLGQRVESAAERDNRDSFGNGARIGVMPLQLVGVPDEDAHLAAGLAEEITTALARFRWMFVISASSLGRFAAQSRDEAAIRRTFGIDFLLDGTIQRARDQLRVTVRLLDLRGNQVVWARRFDRQSEDLLTLQDEIAAEVVAQIDPEILQIEARRSSNRPPVDATAYDLMLRAIPLTFRLDREPFMEAGALLQRAIELEPDYAAAHAWYAYWHVFLAMQGWSDDPRGVMLRSGQLAERAIVLDPYDARGLTIAAHVRAFLHRRLREGAALHDRALSLNPNLAMAWALSAANHAYMGDADEAERRAKRYKQLSPLDPHSFYFDGFFAVIHLLRRNYEAAVAVGRTVTQMNPSLSSGFKTYIAALGHLGRTQEAAVALRRLLQIDPEFSVARFLEIVPLARECDIAIWVEGLRLAGVPSGEPRTALPVRGPLSDVAE